MSEEALLIAVRDRIREFCGCKASECDVQPDDFVPNDAGDFYVAVIPGDLSAGPRHESSGGVIDEIYGVQVAVYQRAASVPKDRQRDLYLTNVGGIAQRCAKVKEAIDFSYEVMNAAGLLITDSTEKFVQPLKWRSTGKAEHADAEVFNSATYKGTQKGGVKRMLTFGGARRIQTR